MSNGVFLKIKKIWKNKVVNNARWMIGEQIIQMLISLVIGMITARYLGPANYGVIDYCYAYVSFFLSVCTLGLEGVLVKEILDHPESEGQIIGSAILMRLASSFLSMIAITAIIMVLNNGDWLYISVGLLQALVLVFRAFDTIDFWFQSRFESKYIAIIKMIAYVIVACYKVYILVAAKSVEWFAFSTTLDFLIIAVLACFAYKKKGGQKFGFSMEISKRMLKNSYHFIISGVIVTLYSQMDKVMIQQFLNDTQVGLYGAASKVCVLWTFIPNAITNSARPAIMKLKGVDEEGYIKRLKQLYAVLIWLGIGFSLIVTIFARLIILILYGEDYLGAVNALVICVWYTTFSIVGVARGIWIVCENKNKYVKKMVAWGTLANFVLNLALIPIWGIEGAAVATLVTQIITCLIAPLFYKETRIHTKYVIEAFLLKGIK